MLIEISRETIAKGVGIVLRVPSLFIAEIWFRNDPQSVQQQYTNNTGRNVDPNLEIIFSVIYYAGMLPLSILKITYET